MEEFSGLARLWSRQRPSRRSRAQKDDCLSRSNHSEFATNHRAMANRIPLIVKVLIGVAGLVVCGIATVVLLLSAPIQRENRLRELIGEMPKPALSLDARKKAAAYGTAWMKVFATLGTAGVSSQEILDKAYYKELLPLIDPFKEGSLSEQHVFKASETIFKAIAYVGANMRSKHTGWSEPDMNRLLRLTEPATHHLDVMQISDGVGEMLLDYMQIVDPIAFKAVFRANQARELVK